MGIKYRGAMKSIAILNQGIHLGKKIMILFNSWLCNELIFIIMKMQMYLILIVPYQFKWYAQQ